MCPAFEPTENYVSTPQFPSALWTDLVSLSSLFWFFQAATLLFQFTNLIAVMFCHVIILHFTLLT